MKGVIGKCQGIGFVVSIITRNRLVNKYHSVTVINCFKQEKKLEIFEGVLFILLSWPPKAGFFMLAISINLTLYSTISTPTNLLSWTPLVLVKYSAFVHIWQEFASKLLKINCISLVISVSTSLMNHIWSATWQSYHTESTKIEFMWVIQQEIWSFSTQTHHS